VALARVAMGLHYLSDIVAGTLLGILVALIGLQIYMPLFNWAFKLLGFSLW
jgi:membrane-associated phospholipid phosphatase